MKQKVLVVGSSLNDKGGIVTVIENINNSNISKEFNMDMVETYITGSALKRITIFLRGLVVYLFKLMFKRPDIIHIHMSYNGSFYRKSIFLLLGKLFNVPVIIHVHGSSFKDFYAGLSDAKQRFCRFILNKTDKLVVLSEEWRRFFSDLVKKEKIQVLYNGVTKSNFTLEPKNNPIPICLFMGRLGKRKGTYDLIEAVKILKNKGIQAKFLLAGDGEIDKVKSEIEANALNEYFDVVGWINGEQKQSLLETSDILVLPSYNEGLPMAILEAMNYGLPIISTPVGGIPEVIKDNQNGFLVIPGDVPNLAVQLEKVISDQSLQYKMGKNNQKKIAEQFDLDVLLKDLSITYKQLIKNN